jgi:hypothetical protein
VEEQEEVIQANSVGVAGEYRETNTGWLERRPRAPHPPVLVLARGATTPTGNAGTGAELGVGAEEEADRVEDPLALIPTLL